MTATITFGPETTPSTIRQLIFITCGVSLFSALTEPLLRTIFGLPGLSYLLALSKQGLQHYYIWQPLSFLFIEDTGGGGLSFSFLINLAFFMYLLWIMGSQLLEEIGQPAFIRFYLFSGLFAGLIGLAALYLTGQNGQLAGPAPAVLAVITAWTLFYPERELLLFFLFPVKAKWLWGSLAAAIVLIYLSHLDWVSLAFYGSALLFGYVYAVMAWERKGPFAWMHRFDRLWRLGSRVSRQTKIIDFKTGEPLQDDNHFVDAMLEKISKEGEASLSWKQRQRLQEISKKKQLKK